jgi:predicted nucleic acid-binding protein
MITALDTNILLDVFSGALPYAERSLDAARQASDEGRVVICEIVFAELCQPFATLNELNQVLGGLDVSVEPVGQDGCFLAGQTFKHYRKAGGRRERVLADFLIAAHAQTRCSRLVTRDRGFYRSYFPQLTILDPSK